MNILIAKYDDGSRIPGARLAPIKFYEKYKVFGRYEMKFLSINITDIKNNEKKLKELNNIIINNEISLALGDDHSITYFLAKSVSRKKSCLVILDAHLDYFPQEESEVKNWNYIEFLLKYFSKVVVLGERNFEYKKVKMKK